MITTNVTFRTFHIRFGDSTGTAFTIDHESRQYLVTAGHVVKGICSGDAIQIFVDNAWKHLVVVVVGWGEDGADVAVLASSVQLSPTFPLLPSSAGLLVGQQVFFLGYPYGWRGGAEKINRGIPIPFVKSGFMSAMVNGKFSHFFLDAHGNRGFSGGPVVFNPQAQSRDELRIAGIVIQGPRDGLPIIDKSGRIIRDSDGNPIARVRENTGFVVALNIKHAMELIEANPIGFPLPSE